MDFGFLLNHIAVWEELKWRKSLYSSLGNVPSDSVVKTNLTATRAVFSERERRTFPSAERRSSGLTEDGGFAEQRFKLPIQTKL